MLNQKKLKQRDQVWVSISLADVLISNQYKKAALKAAFLCSINSNNNQQQQLHHSSKKGKDHTRYLLLYMNKDK